MKRIVWIGDSLVAIRRFPPEAKREAGFQLERLQCGMQPHDWKPMPSIGPGVEEIRVRGGGAHRVLYTARFPEAVYVLHAFAKRSRKTARADLELGRTRYRVLMQYRMNSGSQR
jgi:phage-related protein